MVAFEFGDSEATPSRDWAAHARSLTPPDPTARRNLVSLLDADPELAEAVPESERRAARRWAAAHVLESDGSHWDPEAIMDRAGPDLLGLFVIGGLVVRQIEVAGRAAGELLGAGDVFCPWDEDNYYAPDQVTVDWIVLAPVRLAVLDVGFARRIARWPEIWSKLLQRSAQRASHEAVIAAVTSMPRVDERLLLAFWLLAGRWGRVRSDGVLIRLPLTHKLLALIVGAQRPTITTALSRLAAAGLLLRQPDDGWLLTTEGLHQLRRPARPRATLQDAG